MHSFMTAAVLAHSPADDTARDLATPVLEIEERMLLVPLIGAIDYRRADRMSEQLLRAVERTRARVVVVDTTGVSRLDGPGTDRLLGTIDAAGLLGALVILTGVYEPVANAIVSARATLDELSCAADLRSGIEMGRLALQLRTLPGPELRVAV